MEERVGRKVQVRAVLGAAGVLGRNSRPKSQWVKGAAAKKFQKKAMGKFFSTVPSQSRGSSCTGESPRMIWKRMVAARLMEGHMMATVPPWRSS